MDVQMSPDSEESYRTALQELDEESNDPQFFTDNLSAEAHRFQLSSDAELGRQSQAKEADATRVFQRQKRLDDAAVGIILKALETGMRLDDPIYTEMLAQYPHFQVKLEQRENEITEMRKFIQKLDLQEPIEK